MKRMDIWRLSFESYYTVVDNQGKSIRFFIVRTDRYVWLHRSPSIGHLPILCYLGQRWPVHFSYIQGRLDKLSTKKKLQNKNKNHFLRYLRARFFKILFWNGYCSFSDDLYVYNQTYLTRQAVGLDNSPI